MERVRNEERGKPRRTSYSQEFIRQFKHLYSRHGQDILCLPKLREDWIDVYPFLDVQDLMEIRHNRSDAFKKARSEYVEEVTGATHKNEFEVLMRAKDLNTRTCEKLMIAQEKMLTKMDLLDESDQDYELNFTAILRMVVSLQEKINSFAGLDLARQLELFKEKLLAKKLVDEKSLDSLIGMFAEGGGTLSGTVKASIEDSGRPSITIIDDDEPED